ncbi:MAG: mechanosensitive ion channel family protein [Flavobacteriales bacterium]|nr:mechanosensitive ion channel family protein [Flavobacteriales bacterium]MBL0034323.1 mechanosensitive ion channel family protein [Flavobacteriales bacterium]
MNLTDELDRLRQKLGFDLLLLGKVVLIVVAAFILEQTATFLMKRAYLRSNQDPEDRTRYRFLRNATRLIVGILAFIGIIYSVPSLKHFAVTLFAGAGILVALLGLAAKDAFGNIISGVFIVSFKPFRVGDLIRVGDTYQGVVEDITLRHTVLNTFENRRVIIPNAIISDEVITNSTIRDEATCEFIEVGIGYESDLDRAMAVMAEECEQHPDCLDRRTPDDMERGMAKVPVRLVQIAESSLILRAAAWAKDPVVARSMHYDLNRIIKLRFDKEDIELPYPHRTITYKKGQVPTATA